ncbi:MAG TPA: ABC transporter substrate-binding protein [Verrucomicrobiae bacterium]|jgi:branched-chain amino acid transport system substrate-binding protein|nr:ABC transporter substrate-binding protein [Verrucomicrobiae bacterium]
MRIRSCSIAVGLICAALLAGCNKSNEPAGGASGSDVIKVGEFASLTGKEADFGQSSHDGTELAIEELNASGGVLGKKLELHTEDDQSKQGESKTIARKLISRDGVVAMLGEVASGRSLEAAPVCQESKIPQISPSSTNPKVTEIGDYIFRICFTDPQQGKVLAQFALGTLKAHHVAILTDAATPYSVGLATYFKDAYTAAGGEVVAEQKYSSGDKDFNAQLTAIKAANPDALFVPGYYTEVCLIARQAHDLGITVPLFGGDGWESPQLISIGGDAVDGDYFSTHFSPDEKDPAVEKFVHDFQAKYGMVPDAMAALGYDSAMLLADAMKRAGSSDGPKVRDALAATKDFPGITGNITIDPERNAKKALVIIQVKGGKFHLVQKIAPE